MARLEGMQVITEPDAYVELDSSDLVTEMKELIAKSRGAGTASPKL